MEFYGVFSTIDTTATMVSLNCRCRVVIVEGGHNGNFGSYRCRIVIECNFFSKIKILWA